MTTHQDYPATPEPHRDGEADDQLIQEATPPHQAPESHEAAASSPRRLEVSEGEWKRVSPKYIVVELIGEAIFALVVIGAAILLAVLFEQDWQWWVMAALLAVTVLTAAFTPRRIRSIGYQLRQDDLIFRRGIMWTRIVAVPYGRMQLIDINRGPVARAFGLADLKFVTASAASAIVLPGLAEHDAEQLRDHLVSVAESRRTGL